MESFSPQAYSVIRQSLSFTSEQSSYTELVSFATQRVNLWIHFLAASSDLGKGTCRHSWFHLPIENISVKERKPLHVVCVVESVRNTPSTDTMPASSSQTCADNQDLESTTGSYLANAQEEDSAQNLPTAHVRPSHPLKSFAVPAVPPAGSTYDPALPSTPLLTQQGEQGTAGKTKRKRGF